MHVLAWGKKNKSANKADASCTSFNFSECDLNICKRCSLPSRKLKSSIKLLIKPSIGYTEAKALSECLIPTLRHDICVRIATMILFSSSRATLPLRMLSANNTGELLKYGWAPLTQELDKFCQWILFMSFYITLNIGWI